MLFNATRISEIVYQLTREIYSSREYVGISVLHGIQKVLQVWICEHVNYIYWIKLGFTYSFVLVWIDFS